MTKIVFACKSNSCRSQMAEGWARDWVRRRREDVDRMLVEEDEESNGGSYGSGDFEGSAAGKTSGDFVPDSSSTKPNPKCCVGSVSSSAMERKCTTHRAKLLRRSSSLNEVVVTSVALDSSSVFECSSCCGDLCETQSQRKAVKEKAVKTMAEDGIDISAFVPKTIEEVMPYLVTGGRNLSAGSRKEEGRGRALTIGSSKIEQISAACSSTLFLSDIAKEGVSPSVEPHSSTALDDDTRGGCSNAKPVDKLIILCSCGDAVKRKLVRRSKSVEEWSVDAPTAAAKAGEGDEAYRRVSHEIRREVDTLLDSLLEIGDDDSDRWQMVRKGEMFGEEKKMNGGMP